MSVPGGDSRFRVMLMVPKTCDDAVVLIQPDSPTTPGTPANAYIASVWQPTPTTEPPGH